MCSSGVFATSVSCSTASERTGPMPTRRSIGPDERDLLRAYALQLLLCLDCEELVSRRLYFKDWRTATALAEAFRLMDLAIVIQDSELFGVMQVLGLIVKKLPRGDTKELMECVRPLIIRSMASEDNDTFIAAMQLLDGIACGLKWHRTRLPLQDVEAPVVINSQLASAAIRNMTRVIVKGNIGMEELRKALNLFDWFIESMRYDPLVAKTLDDAGIGELFAYCVRKSANSSGNYDDSGLMLHRGGDVVEGTWQHVMLLLGLVFLGTRVSDADVQLSGDCAPTLSPADCNAVAQYMRFFVQPRTKNDISLRIIRLLFGRVLLLVEKAFRRSPNAATQADLDSACEAVVQTLIDSQRQSDSTNANQDRLQAESTPRSAHTEDENTDFDQFDEPEDELAGHVLRAQQSYAHARLRSQHAATTWWKSEGVLAGCSMTYPPSLVL